MTRDKHPSLAEERRRILEKPGCRRIEPQVYCEMALSNRKLLRFDHPGALLRGLFDPAADMQFLIEEERLFDHRAL